MAAYFEAGIIRGCSVGSEPVNRYELVVPPVDRSMPMNKPKSPAEQIEYLYRLGTNAVLGGCCSRGTRSLRATFPSRIVFY